MDYLSAQHLNAFKVMTDQESISSASNMSGTFNKQSNPLKINQRKQKKSSYQPSEKGDLSQSEHESLSSFRKDNNKHLQQDEIKSNSSNQKNQQKTPPPPPLMQSLTRAFLKLAAKHGPPPMVTATSNGSVGAANNEKQNAIHSKQSSNQLQNKYNKAPGILSPPIKDYDRKDAIKEESQESNSILRKTDLDNSISQDQIPINNDDDPFIIKINVKNHSNIPANVKIPNPNYNILEQAKFLLMNEIQGVNESEIQLTEELLSRTIKQIHQVLMKQKEHEYERSLGEYNKQVLSLQAKLSLQQTMNNPQISPSNPFKKQGTVTENGLAGLMGFAMSQKLNLNDSNQLIEAQNNQEDNKKLREDNQELRMKAQYLEQDLAFLSQKTKDLQTKYETEIENLRSLLKGSQSEQFVKQQVEHKKLIEDNSVLMREVKLLQDQLREEQHRVVELFEDAQTVREEIMREMSDYEKTKKELEKMKILNKNLRKRLNDDSIEQSEVDHSDEERSDDQRSVNDLEGRMKKKKIIQKVSVGLSRPESLLSLANGFNQKLEELIEEKSKSIINVLAQSQLTNMVNYQHPYQINYQYRPNGQNAIQNGHQQTQGYQPARRPTYQKLNGQIVEISMYESEEGGHNYNPNHLDSRSQLENHVSSDTSSHHHQILKSNSSDIQVLKHKIREVRDKHNSQLQSTSSFLKLNNASVDNINPVSDVNHSLSKIGMMNKISSNNFNNQRLDTEISQPETFKAFNSGLIKQENQPLRNYERIKNYGNSNKNQNVQFYNSLDDNDEDEKSNDDQESGFDNQEIMMQQQQQMEANQFKTPVWTQQQRIQDYRANQYQNEEDRGDDEDSYLRNQDDKQLMSQDKTDLNQQSFVNNTSLQKDKMSFSKDTTNQSDKNRQKQLRMPYSP